ncbi:MAG: SRPBCC family protein [Dehalococcoidia bacterium]|jgi:uncharacterized membrane protein
MAKIHKEIWIGAPLERIFDYISYPGNLPEIWPGLIEINDVRPLPNGGYSLRWAYKMLGLRFEGNAEYTRLVPNEFCVIETTGGIKSTIVWTVRSWDSRTRVTFTVDYKVPIPLLGKIAEAIIIKINDQEGEIVMANLNARFMTII